MERGCHHGEMSRYASVYFHFDHVNDPPVIVDNDVISSGCMVLVTNIAASSPDGIVKFVFKPSGCILLSFRATRNSPLSMTQTEEIVSIGALMENRGNRKTPDTIVALLSELSMFKGGSLSTPESIEELLVDSSGSSIIG